MLWLGWLGWYGSAFVKGYPLLDDIQQFYPHGVNLLVYLNGFSLDAILALPVILTGQYILAYNLLSIVSIWLSAFSAYLMCYDLVKSRLPAIFGGIAFGFGAFQMAQALGGHLSIFGPFWLPLTVLVLNRIVQGRATKKIAFLGGLFSMFAALTNGYWGIVVVFILSFYLLLWVLPWVFRSMRNRSLRSRLEPHFGVMVCFGLPLLGLLLVLLALKLPSQPPWGPIEYLYWGTSPLDYILPSFLHPIFGPILLSFYATFSLSPFRWGSLTERDLYLGITPIILTIYAILVKRDSIAIKLGLVGLGFIILSLGPFLKVFGFHYNVEPYNLFSSLPFFRAARVVSRLGLGTLLFCSLISSIGMSYLQNAKIRKPAKSQLIGVILIVILLFEIIPTIPYPITDPTNHSSAVYVWLSNQPGTFGVLEYPVTYSDGYAGYHMEIAGKYTTSGYVNIAPADLMSYLMSISFLQPNDIGQLRPVNTTLLRALDIRYILLHEDEYTALYGSSTLVEALAEANMTVGLRYVNVIDQTVIYEVA